MKWIFKFHIWVLMGTVVSLLSSMGCSNIFEQAAKKTSDEALYESALQSLDAMDYDQSLSYFNQLSASFAARDEVREQWAGAYAGKCGLNFIQFFMTLTETGSSAALFQYFMSAFDGIALDPASCVLAEEKIKEIGATPLERTDTQNLFMMILGMAKVGIFLRHEADNAEADGLGDGAMDAGFDACTVDGTETSGNGSFSDTDIKQIVTGLGLIFENFAVVGAAISGGSTADSLNDLATACGVLVPNPCTITDVADVDNTTVTNMRYLIHTSSTHPSIPMGIGGCNNPDITQCCGL